jgi:hypothetical protein
VCGLARSRRSSEQLRGVSHHAASCLAGDPIGKGSRRCLVKAWKDGCPGLVL